MQYHMLSLEIGVGVNGPLISLTREARSGGEVRHQAGEISKMLLDENDQKGKDILRTTLYVCADKKSS